MYVHAYIYKYMYGHIYIYIYIYICIYIYIKIRCASANTASDVCLQRRHQDQITSSFAWMLLPIVCSESQRLPHCHMCLVTWLIHMCDMTHSYACHDSFISQRLPHCHMCTTPHSLHQRYLKFFSCPPICVCIILHTYIRPHTRRMNSSTHIMSDSLYAYKHTDPKKRTQSKERESKRDREEMWGGRFLEIGSGWWSGLHLQMLEACLPMGWLRLVGCLKKYMSLCRI